MDIPADTLVPVLYVLGLELYSRLVGIRYDKEVQPEGQECDYRSREHIRDHHPVETYSAGKYGDNLRVRSHLGSKEYDRNEHEQRTEHVYEVRHEVHVVVKDNCLEGSFLGHEVIDLLTDVEDDDDAYDKQQCHKEGSHELLYYI